MTLRETFSNGRRSYSDIQPSVGSMPNYRIFLMNAGGQVVRAFDQECGGDTVACARAWQEVTPELSAEVWQGKRVVEWVPPASARNPESQRADRLSSQVPNDVYVRAIPSIEYPTTAHKTGAVRERQRRHSIPSTG